ncbi:hypothetical protein EYF80_043581 [Liparis tanakae]|uniref:Uncharacterized protein n=1 Tax=Liparis tanakae TaxID=230148 RepID=A0A4Z2FZ19_9TELE|nr:hypothetical protein EYF80_043581 [Liparis tanakae]
MTPWLVPTHRRPWQSSRLETHTWPGGRRHDIIISPHRTPQSPTTICHELTVTGPPTFSSLSSVSTATSEESLASSTPPPDVPISSSSSALTSSMR